MQRVHDGKTIMGNVSHDSVTRFLHREDYTKGDLFKEVKPHINLKGGTHCSFDSVIDKPYSDPTKS